MIGKGVGKFTFLVLSIWIIGGSAQAVAAPKVPAPVGDIYVQDFANVLSGAEKNVLLSLGRQIEDQTTAQVVVLTVPTLDGEPIEDFANSVFRKYGIGSKSEDNGVLLVIDIETEKSRIEVGYGLEGRIPDGKAGRILDEYTVPSLKNGQPNIAVMDTYQTLANEVMAEYSGQEIQPQSSQEKGLGIPYWLLILIIIGVGFLDFKYFGGTLTYLLISIVSRGGGQGGGPRGGGGGSSGGGGASR